MTCLVGVAPEHSAAVATVRHAERSGASGRAPHSPQRRIPPTTRLTDLSGRTHILLAKPLRAAVLLFIAHDCPISNRYVPEMNRIVDRYTSRRVAFYAIYAEPDANADTLRKHWKDYALHCPGVLDKELNLAKQTGATVTPEAIALDSAGRMVYAGRIDDRFVSLGVERSHPTTHDLRDALDALLAGRKPPHATTTPIGCFIALPAPRNQSSS